VTVVLCKSNKTQGLHTYTSAA